MVDEDLSVVRPSRTPGEGDGVDVLIDDELAAYGAFDKESDAMYQRRIQQAYHVRELKQIDDIIKSRKEYANKIFKMVIWWLIGIGVFCYWMV